MLDGRRSSPLELLFPGWQGWTESRKFPARLGPLLVPALPVWRSPGLGHAQASSCPHHTSPFPQHFPHLDLTLFSFCLPIPRQSTMQVWISAVFLSFPVPTVVLPAGSTSSRSVAQHCHCPQLLCPSGGRAVSQHCHPSAIPPLPSPFLAAWCKSGHRLSSLSFPHSFLHHPGKGTANTFLSFVLCLV